MSERKSIPVTPNGKAEAFLKLHGETIRKQKGIVHGDYEGFIDIEFPQMIYAVAFAHLCEVEEFVVILDQDEAAPMARTVVIQVHASKIESYKLAN